MCAKRQALGYTQKELADLCGICDATISNFENGKKISDDNYNKIVKVIEDKFNSFGRMERNLALLRTDVILLDTYETPLEMAKALTFINGRTSMIMTDVLKEF
jgi:transcriptional regulator with XRE-family HTH domain